MNKSLEKINLNQNQVVSGVALFSTAALSVYTIKNTLETNKKIDEIYEDLNKIKNFVTENQRKNNINTAAINAANKLFRKCKNLNLNQTYFWENNDPKWFQKLPNYYEAVDCDEL